MDKYDISNKYTSNHFFLETSAQGFGRSVKVKGRTTLLDLYIATQPVILFDRSSTCYETWNLNVSLDHKNII